MGSKKRKTTVRADGHDEKDEGEGNRNTRAVAFSVLGMQPVAWPKKESKVIRKGGRYVPVTYRRDPKGDFKAWEELVAMRATLAMKSEGMAMIPKGVPVAMGCVFVMKKPKSIPKSRVWPTVKPDMDNLEYAIMNILKGLTYYDDSQVVLRLPGGVFYSDDEWGDETLNVGAHITVAPVIREDLGEIISGIMTTSMMLLAPKEKLDKMVMNMLRKGVEHLTATDDTNGTVN